MFPLPRLSRADLSTLPEIIFQSKYPLKEESVPPPPRLSSLLNTLPAMKLQYCQAKLIVIFYLLPSCQVF